ncbi:MAG: hypothetical protein WCH21_02265 [Bacteroidota bacterium]
MIIKQKYKDINDTMAHIKIQIKDSLKYAAENCPPLYSPENCFFWLKSRTTYKNDPQGIELLQTLPTLLDNNFHGISGAGDCDCFTISICALLIANNFKNINICLVGRSKTTPVHIYVVVYKKGKRIVLDLTNKAPNIERPYPYIQELPITIKK